MGAGGQQKKIAYLDCPHCCDVRCALVVVPRAVQLRELCAVDDGPGEDEPAVEAPVERRVVWVLVVEMLGAEENSVLPALRLCLLLGYKVGEG